MNIDSAMLGYITEEVTYSDGDVIMGEGSHGNWVYIIIKGQAKVKKKTPVGIVTIETLSEGDTVGDMNFLEGGKSDRNETVVASGSPVELGILDRDRLEKEYEEIPPRIRTLIKCLMKQRRKTVANVCSAVSELYGQKEKGA